MHDFSDYAVYFFYIQHMRHALTHVHPRMLWAILGFIVASLFCVSVVLAQTSTSEFTQEITADNLTVSIVDSDFATVGSPSFTMGASTFSFDCTTSTGIFGATSTQMIYVQNPDAADGGWTLTFAAAATTTLWEGATYDMDFNDAGITSGCPSNADNDAESGRLHVYPNTGILAAGQCGSCTTSDISLGSSAGFQADTVDDITILSAAAGSDDIGDWTLTNVMLQQAIPEGQQPDSYTIDLVLTVASS